jgi:hypothetical protein
MCPLTAKRLISGLLTLSLSLTTGCATMLNSGPSVLDVTVEHPYQGVTTTVTATATKQSSQQTSPHFQLLLDKGSDYVLTMQSPGYRADQAVVNRSLHPGFWVDMALLAPLAAVLAGFTLNAPNSQGLVLMAAFIAAITVPVGLVSLSVDAMTNAIWTHDQRQVRVRLIPEPSRP